MKLLRLSLLACALAPLPAAAQEAPLRSGNWQMIREGSACAARISGTTGSSLTVWQQADGTQSVLLGGPAFLAHPKALLLQLEVLPARQFGQKKDPEAIRFDVSGEPGKQGLTVKAELGLTMSFWDASQISVQPRGKRMPLATFAPGANGMPAAELRRCREEISRVDRGTGRLVAKPGAPQVPVVQIITSNDYPPQAMQNEWTGRTVIRLTVSAKGLVSGCTTATSSGHAILDQQACILYSRRARFTPALDADSKATEAVYMAPVVWMLAQ